MQGGPSSERTSEYLSLQRPRSHWLLAGARRGLCPTTVRAADDADRTGAPIHGRAEQRLKREAGSSFAPLLGRRVPDRSDLGFENRDLGGPERQGGRLPHEFARRRDVEVGFERRSIFPPFNEHHSELVLDVTVNAV